MFLLKFLLIVCSSAIDAEDLSITNEKNGDKSVINETNKERACTQYSQMETLIPTWKKIFSWIQCSGFLVIMQ